MGYKCHDFCNGQVLKAEALNEMELGILNSIRYTKQNLTPEQKAQARENIGVSGKVQVCPEFANSIEECTDTNKAYMLPDGHIYAYMPETGALFTDHLKNAIGEDGKPFNDGLGYDHGHLSGGGAVEPEYEDEEYVEYTEIYSGFIPCSLLRTGDQTGTKIIRITGVKNSAIGTGGIRLLFYGELGGAPLTNETFKTMIEKGFGTYTSDGYNGSGVLTFDFEAYADHADNSWWGSQLPTQCKYIRISWDFHCVPEDAMVLFDEEITFGTGYTWKDTGYTFLSEKDTFLRYDVQPLTPKQKAQARENIGAIGGETHTAKVKNILVDNAMALDTSWNNASIVSCEHDSVVFTRTSAGDGGISTNIRNVDLTQPLILKLTPTVPSGLQLRCFIFCGGKYLTETSVIKNAGEYEIDVSKATDTTLQVILACGFTDATVNQTVTISALQIWQYKDSVVMDIDKDAVLEIVENANITNSPYYTAPNGERYLLQVNNDGTVNMTPVVPLKALFIGNSLLMGFGFGMAASDSEHDYYYLINQAINQQKDGYIPSKLAGYDWENSTSATAQNEYLSGTLQPALSADLELVIIQLGDNVNSNAKLSVFEDGCRQMLEFVRTNCPKARVAWVGAWYQTNEKQMIMEDACKKTGCTFVNIRDLNTIENQNSIGNTYVDEDGNTKTITSAGVASHPNDSGFKDIANRILYKLGIVDNENFYD